MTEEDVAHTRELIQHFRSEAATYSRQWPLSLGIGCGGAAIALISLAANLPDPDFAFRVFAPSLWVFLMGIVASAASLPIAATMSLSQGEHFAESFNRDQLQGAARKMPEAFSAPARLAKEMNAPRNELIRRGDRSHDLAEKAWAARAWLRSARFAALTIAGMAFVVGVSLPLALHQHGWSSDVAEGVRAA